MQRTADILKRKPIYKFIRHRPIQVRVVLRALVRVLPPYHDAMVHILRCIRGINERPVILIAYPVRLEK